MYTLSHLLSEQKSILAEQISTDIFERPKGLPVTKDPEVEAAEVKKKHFLDNIKVSRRFYVPENFVRQKFCLPKYCPIRYLNPI